MGKDTVKDSVKAEIIKDQMIGWCRNFDQRLIKLEQDLDGLREKIEQLDANR